MIDVREYTDPHGRSPFQQWFENLDARAAAKVTVLKIDTLYLEGIY